MYLSSHEISFPRMLQPFIVGEKGLYNTQRDLTIERLIIMIIRRVNVRKPNYQPLQMATGKSIINEIERGRGLLGYGVSLGCWLMMMLGCCRFISHVSST